MAPVHGHRNARAFRWGLAFFTCISLLAAAPGAFATRYVGAAKALTDVKPLGGTRFEVEFRIVVENLRTRKEKFLELKDNLHDTFGSAVEYRVIDLRTDPALHARANPDFDGKNNVSIFDRYFALPAGASTAVDLRLFVDTRGVAEKFYNQAVVITRDAHGNVVKKDLSDNGSDPDPNGNGKPTERGENDPTPIRLKPVDQIPALAKELVSLEQVGATTFDVTFALLAANLGSIPATNIQITDDLQGTFPDATSITVIQPPTVTGALTRGNPGYNGISDARLLSGDENLAVGAQAEVRWTVRVNLGATSGSFENSALITSAIVPGGTPTAHDRSDNGRDPDPNHNGRPDDPGEDDPTPIVITGTEAVVGAAKALQAATQLGPNRFSLAYRFVLTNLSAFAAPNVQLTDDLAAAFPGATSLSVLTGPIVSGGLTSANAAFNGTTATQILSGDEALAAGATATVDLTVAVELAPASGPFANQAIVTTAPTPGGPPIAHDPSDNGNNPDPNGNGNPNEAGENDPTPFDPVTASQRVGLAKALTAVSQVGSTTFDFTFSLVAENLSATTTATNVQVSDDLAATLPSAASITIVGPPVVAGGLSAVNGSYDGQSDIALLAGNEPLAPSARATINWTARVDLGVAAGNFENSAVMTSAATPAGPPLARDVSDDGTTPDSNGNGRANDPGEDDPHSNCGAGRNQRGWRRQSRAVR